MRVIGTMLWLFGGLMEAHAAAPVEVAVVGLHAREQPQSAGERLSAAVDALPSMTTVSPSWLRSQLGGTGARVLTDALQADGLDLLAEGRVLFDQADLQSAKTRISEAVTALDAALAGGHDSRALMDALLVQANIAIAMGDASTAARAFKQAVRIDPRLTLDAVHYPPKVVKLFDDVREQVLAVPLGDISLAGVWSDTDVHVDGRRMGRGITEVRGLVPGRHHVLTTGPDGDRHHAVVQVTPGGVTEFVHDRRRGFLGGAAETDGDKTALTRRLYASLSSTWTDKVVLVAGETGIDEVGIQLYEPRTGRFSIAHRAASEGDPLGAVTTLLPRLEGMCRTDGSLAPEVVSDEGLSLNINHNPTLTRLLFAEAGPSTSDAVVGTALDPRSSALRRERRPARVHWAVWAGAGVLAVGATTAALLLHDSGPSTTGGDVPDGTGTVRVRF